MPSQLHIYLNFSLRYGAIRVAKSTALVNGVTAKQQQSRKFQKI
jgi:hypothetical protein